ncbi:MAG: hypothetical protein LUF85_10085 [Bacteroides sp.]|nr:hypothetical protein [Bacteroides sp.]
MEKFEKASILHSSDPQIYCFWGIALYEWWITENDNDLLTAAFKKLQTAYQLDPTNEYILHNLEIARSKLVTLSPPSS